MLIASLEETIDINIKVITGGNNNDIIDQYVRFTKVINEQLKIYGYTEKTRALVYVYCNYVTAWDIHVKKFSELIDITPRFLYDIETGQKGMSANTLCTISKALNISCDYLLFGKESSDKSEYISGVLSTLDAKSISYLEKIIMNIMELKENKQNG